MPLALPFSPHHIHPILVNFTAALVPASIVSDSLGRIFRRQSLTHAAWWMLVYAAIITPFTALAGLLWKPAVEAVLPPDSLILHQWLGVSLAGLFIALAVWRGVLHSRDKLPGMGYFAVATVVLAALTYQGTVGGAMVFGK